MEDRQTLNARTKAPPRLSVFSDSVKCKTRQRDLKKSESEVDGLWKIERGEGERRDERRGRSEQGEAFFIFFCRIVKTRGELLESLMAFGKRGQREKKSE